MRPRVDSRQRFTRAVTVRCLSTRPVARASPAATVPGPSVGGVDRRRFFRTDAAFRLLQRTRPMGAPNERLILARAGCHAFAEHPRRLPRRPPSREAGVFLRPTRKWSARREQRATAPLRRRRIVGPEWKDPRDCAGAPPRSPQRAPSCHGRAATRVWRTRAAYPSIKGPRLHGAPRRATLLRRPGVLSTAHIPSPKQSFLRRWVVMGPPFTLPLAWSRHGSRGTSAFVARPTRAQL